MYLVVVSVIIRQPIECVREYRVLNVPHINVRLFSLVRDVRELSRSHRNTTLCTLYCFYSNHIVFVMC